MPARSAGTASIIEAISGGNEKSTPSAGRTRSSACAHREVPASTARCLRPP
ncbi:hypothetical protein [Streptomyces zaomyceticus]|uniref:hypothetical protein n=1 Tax=Streptomyces zaomyceticus TaxID=68286 RepID=UPI003440848C